MTDTGTDMLDIIEKIRPVLPDKGAVYLVGGAVRNQLLGIPTRDLDFSVDGNGNQVARRVADFLGAAYYPLDSERDTGRVVITRDDGNHDMLDFARMRGDDLMSDLRDRDFTINAIALDIRNPENLLDPLNGAADLRSEQLRVCSRDSFMNDPLRILRAVRFGIEFGLKIEPETLKLLRDAVPMLTRVSPERLRDELFRILANPKSDTAFRTLDILGVIPEILPELSKLSGVSQSPPHIYDVWDHTLHTLSSIEKLLGVLAVVDYDPNETSNLVVGLAVLRLGRYRERFHAHINAGLVDDRPWLGLLKFAVLYHDVSKPSTKSIDKDGRIRFLQHEKDGSRLVENRARNLRLSSNEISRVKTIVLHHMRIHHLYQTKRAPSRKAIYRFFRDTQDAGVDIILLSLADVMATAGPHLDQEDWVQYLDIARELLEAWWENWEEKISPPLLLNGYDLMEEFGFEPGPQIGKLLSELKEAQACGEVSSREQALIFLQDLLEETNSGV